MPVKSWPAKQSVPDVVPAAATILNSSLPARPHYPLSPLSPRSQIPGPAVYSLKPRTPPYSSPVPLRERFPQRLRVSASKIGFVSLLAAPAGRPLPQKGRYALLRVLCHGVHRHDLLRIGVGFGLVEIDLGVIGVLAQSHY